MNLHDWEELERLVRLALEEMPPEKRDTHDIGEALKLTGAFAASVQKHWQGDESL